MIKLNTTKNKYQSDILSEFTNREISEVILENPSLRGYVQGYLAEISLRKQLVVIPGISSVTKIPDKSSVKGDLLVRYKGVDITIEVKSLKTDTIRADDLLDTWQGTVGVSNSDVRSIYVEGIGEVRNSNLVRGEFDILAVSCYGVSGQWDFVYMENEYMPSKSYLTPTILKASFLVNPKTTPCLDIHILDTLNSVYLKKSKVIC